MELLVAYDRWCVARVRAFLLFLEEWLSISQKYAERGMIAIYVVLASSPPYAVRVLFPFQICVSLCLGSLMWIIHCRPEAVRESTKRIPRLRACVRITLQGILGSVAVLNLWQFPHSEPDRAVAAAQFVYLVFFYMTDIASNGKRGRWRKLAWAKIKELFGTEWIPKPVPVPQ